MLPSSSCSHQRTCYELKNANSLQKVTHRKHACYFHFRHMLRGLGCISYVLPRLPYARKNGNTILIVLIKLSSITSRPSGRNIASQIEGRSFRFLRINIETPPSYYFKLYVTCPLDIHAYRYIDIPSVGLNNWKEHILNAIWKINRSYIILFNIYSKNVNNKLMAKMLQKKQVTGFITGIKIYAFSH